MALDLSKLKKALLSDFAKKSPPPATRAEGFQNLANAYVSYAKDAQDPAMGKVLQVSLDSSRITNLLKTLPPISDDATLFADKLAQAITVFWTGVPFEVSGSTISSTVFTPPVYSKLKDQLLSKVFKQPYGSTEEQMEKLATVLHAATLTTSIQMIHPSPTPPTYGVIS